jgi:hypothetical protein
MYDAVELAPEVDDWSVVERADDGRRACFERLETEGGILMGWRAGTPKRSIGHLRVLSGWVELARGSIRRARKSGEFAREM